MSEQTAPAIGPRTYLVGAVAQAMIQANCGKEVNLSGFVNEVIDTADTLLDAMSKSRHPRKENDADEGEEART